MHLFETLSRKLFLGALLVSCLFSSGAHAFPDAPYNLGEGAARAGKPMRFQLLGEMVGYAGHPNQQSPDDKAWEVSPLIGLKLRLKGNLFFEGVWGLTYFHVNPDRGNTTSTIHPGNPWGAVHYVKYKGNNSFRVGIGVTAPLAILPDQLNKRAQVQAALTRAAAIRGLWNYWLWDADSISAVVPFRWEQHRASGFVWGIESAVGAMIAITDKNAKHDPVIQVATDLGYMMDRVRVGGKINLVIMPVDDINTTQISVEPYMRYGLDNWFATFRLLLNIDSPHGFSLDQHESYGLRLGLGFVL